MEVKKHRRDLGPMLSTEVPLTWGFDWDKQVILRATSIRHGGVPRPTPTPVACHVESFRGVHVLATAQFVTWTGTTTNL